MVCQFQTIASSKKQMVFGARPHLSLSPCLKYKHHDRLVSQPKSMDNFPIVKTISYCCLIIIDIFSHNGTKED